MDETSQQETYVLGKVVRGGVWLYATSVTNNAFGFVYWLLISKIAGPSVLGTTSAIVGAASLVTGLLSLGVPVGLQRYVGRTIGRRDPEEARKYFWSSTILSATLYLAGAAILYALGAAGRTLGNITPQMFRLAALLVLLGTAAPISAFVTAHLKTHILFLSSLVGNAAKLAVGVALVQMGWDWVGATIGYATASLIGLAFTLAYSVRLAEPTLAFSKVHVVRVLKAGLASWIPATIALAGQWLAVLTLYGVSTPAVTGRFYVAMAISNLVVFLATSTLGLLLPVLSGLEDGRKRAANRMLNATLALVTPIAFFVIAQPQLPLSLLGREYTQASTSLQILLLSLIPLAVTTTTTSLLYAYGEYGKVTAIGLAQNIPRIAAYMVLTPLAGSIGASTSYTLGAVTGMMASAVYGRKVGYRVDLAGLTLTALVPAALTAATVTAGWPASLAAASASYAVYMALGVLKAEDVEQIMRALIPR